MNLLRGKTILLTGGSRGIGAETAYKLAGEGAILLVTYQRNRKMAQDLCKKCHDLGAERAEEIELNLGNNKSIEMCAEFIKSNYGHLDVLINNAGVIVWKRLRDQTFDEIEYQIRTNLEGTLKLTKLLLPYIRETIISIGSDAGYMGDPELAPYCATKWGIRGFTKALALDEKSLRIVSVHPGMTKTDMTGYRGVPPQDVADIILRTAKGEFGKSSGDDVNIFEML